MQVGIDDEDLRRLYALLNAHEVILRVLLAAMVAGDAAMFEQWRFAIMEAGDQLRRGAGAPDVGFVDEGRLETLAMLARTLAAARPPEADGAA